MFDNVHDATLSDARIRGIERVRNGVDWGWFPDSWRFVRCGRELYAGLREIVIDSNRCPPTFSEFTLKEFERDKEGNWIDDMLVLLLEPILMLHLRDTIGIPFFLDSVQNAGIKTILEGMLLKGINT